MVDIRCLDEAHGQNWAAYNGDCCDVLRQMPDQSVGFSVYSPPFANLFVYSDSVADMGNCANYDEFFAHYEFVLREKLRVTKPGRLSAVHCTDIPRVKWKQGYSGTIRFSDMIADAHEAAGWHFARRITVWKDPVVEQTRSNALNLLYMQLKKDSTKSWPGLADYVMLFRAPGENTEPVGQDEKKFPLDQWQQWASPVWMDIRQTKTLNVQMAREAEDERHLCPLQLDLIERSVIMWSNPGNVVLSPFMGIGSEGSVSLKQKRKFVGVELEKKYFKHAVRHLDQAERNAASLFDHIKVA